MKQYVVDAFTDMLFKGNQAAVCVLEKWLPDELMRNIAKENNFSETAFAVKEKDGYRLRWFTPGGEIDFCGHATLGTSFVLFNYYEKDAEEITFYTQVGNLIIKRDKDMFVMNFPAYKCNPVPVTEAMAEAIGVMPVAAYLDRDLLLVLQDEEQVKRVGTLLMRAGLPVGIPDYIDRRELVKKLYTDKKVRNGKLRFVLQNGIGDVVRFGENVYATSVSEDIAREIINML